MGELRGEEWREVGAGEGRIVPVCLQLHVERTGPACFCTVVLSGILVVLHQWRGR